jgi:hypothetical protein
MCCSIEIAEFLQSIKVENHQSIGECEAATAEYEPDFKSLDSSFIRWTKTFNASFSSSSDSRNAFLSMAVFIRASTSSRDARVSLVVRALS